MAVTPSLSEIQNYGGDAAIGAAAGGANISVVESGASLPYLQVASKYIADATKTEAEQYNKNLQDALTGVGTIKTDGIMNSDYKGITENYASYLKDFFENPDIFRNPLKNPSLYNEFKQKELNLRTTIEQSKQQKKLYDTSLEQLQKHPEWDNEENKALLSSYEKTPIGERQVFTLKPPFIPDIGALAKTVEAAATVKTASSDLVKAGKFIRTEKGEYVDMAKAEQSLEAALTGNDSFNRSLRQGYQKMFDAMPPQEQAKYTGLKDFLQRNVFSLLKLPQTTESKLDENRVLMQDKQLANTNRNADADRALQRRGQDIQLEIAGLRGSANKVSPEQAGRLKVELMTSLFTNGDLNQTQLQTAFGDDKKVEVTVKKMAPADPSKPFNALTNPNVDQGESTKELKSRIEVLGSTKNADGTISVKTINNATGKEETKVYNQQKASEALNNILGADKANIVSTGAAKFLKDRTGSEIFDLDKAKPIFTNSNSRASSGYSADQEAGIKRVMDANPGYSREQIINGLKKQKKLP